jgi:large subunit ribosomal protein L28
MANKCDICGKMPISGTTISRRGLAKKKGGVGKKITGITKRRFYPNMQKMTAIVNGSRKRIKVCVSCMKAGKVVKA